MKKRSKWQTIGTVLGETNINEFFFSLKNYQAKKGDIVATETNVPDGNGKIISVTVWGKIMSIDCSNEWFPRQAAQELADSIYSSTATFQAENLRTSYMDRIKGVGLENRDMQDILTHQNYGLLTGTPLGNLISQATGNYEVGDPRGSDGLAAATQLFAMLEDVLGSDEVTNTENILTARIEELKVPVEKSGVPWGPVIS